MRAENPLYGRFDDMADVPLRLPQPPPSATLRRAVLGDGTGELDRSVQSAGLEVGERSA